MWVCKRFNEQVDNDFFACWNCGTEADGAPTEQMNAFQTARDATSADQAAAAEQSTSPQAFASGTRMIVLPGERLVRSLRVISLLGPEEAIAYLTTHRLVFTIKEHTLGFIPAGRSERIALLGDVDSAGVTIKRLPVAVALIGLMLLAAATAAGLMSDAGRWAVFAFAAGGFLLLLWLFVRRTWLVFSVGGIDCFGMAMVRSGSDDIAVEEFIQTLFKLKTRRRRTRG